jgi:hypothetical protein
MRCLALASRFIGGLFAAYFGRSTLYHTPLRVQPSDTISVRNYLSLPHCAELSINPLAPRIVRLLNGSNFRDFVRFLAAFSSRARTEDKVRFMFECYDVDGDGEVSPDDLRNLMTYLVAGHMSDDQVETVLTSCFDEAGAGATITLEQFSKFVDVSRFQVQVPRRM